MPIDQQVADEFDDARLQRVAFGMRQAFFKEFGDLDKLSTQQVTMAVRSMIGLHAMELLETAARFKRPEATVRETAIAFLDAMLAANQEEIAAILGENDQMAYLAGTQESVAGNDNATIPSGPADYTGAAWEIARTIANLWALDFDGQPAKIEACAVRLQRFRDSGARAMMKAAVEVAHQALCGADAAKRIKLISVRSPFGVASPMAQIASQEDGLPPSPAEMAPLRDALDSFMAAQAVGDGLELQLTFERLRAMSRAFLDGTLGDGTII